MKTLLAALLLTLAACEPQSCRVPQNFSTPASQFRVTINGSWEATVTKFQDPTDPNVTCYWSDNGRMSCVRKVP